MNGYINSFTHSCFVRNFDYLKIFLFKIKLLRTFMTQTFVVIYFCFSWIYTQEWNVCVIGKCMFRFCGCCTTINTINFIELLKKGTSNSFIKSQYYFIFPPGMQENPSFPYSSYFHFFNYPILMSVKLYLNVV